MKLIINNSSMQPIYEQICTQIKNKILSGELKQEEILPARIRAYTAPQGQHDVASHVGLGFLCRRCGEREDGR